MKKPQVNDKLSINKNVFNIVGIDHYSLKNIGNQKINWNSYTLKNRSNRRWMTIIGGKFYLWKESKIIPKKSKFNYKMSGIAEIRFRGDKGFSTPLAELLWFNLNKDNFQFFVIERFLETSKNNLKVKNYFYLGKELKKEEVKLL